MTFNHKFKGFCFWIEHKRSAVCFCCCCVQHFGFRQVITIFLICKIQSTTHAKLSIHLEFRVIFLCWCCRCYFCFAIICCRWFYLVDFLWCFVFKFFDCWSISICLIFVLPQYSSELRARARDPKVIGVDYF